MRYTTEISCDGPYLRVFFPDVMPPDWGALRRELEPDFGEGVTRVTLVISQTAGVTSDDPSLLDMVESLQSSGVDVVVMH